VTYLLHDLLTSSAAQHPDRPAVGSGVRSLTYTELDGAVDRVAAFLRRRGVVPGDRVGLMVEKSESAVVAIFGILKAGGVYVPVDPHIPPQRAAFILKDCGVRTVIASPDERGRSFAGLLPPGALETVIVAGADASRAPTGLAVSGVFGWQDALAARTMRIPEERIDTDLAYVLYTSGSTGEPKGVMISHRNALTFVDWAVEQYGIRPDDRLSNHAPFHFDLSVFDIYAAMSVGASVHPVPEGLSVFPVKLSRWIADQRISVWYSVPSILALLALYGALGERDLRQIRTILFAGEVFPIKHLKTLVAALPNARYANLYGPTETNVCTYHEVDVAAVPWLTQTLPIGRACANTSVFAVTDEDRPAAPGEEGELLVRGSGVALGYWGRPERTAQGFVQNPLLRTVRDIVYRTGDVVVLDASGEYRFIGRKDHQIKSRGYRIELGEVEHVLHQHESIREAAVVAVPDELVGNRIRAVVVPVSGAELTSVAVRAHCASRLPGYMVPELVDVRPDLPRTPNGKVDRQRLMEVK